MNDSTSKEMASALTTKTARDSDFAGLATVGATAVAKASLRSAFTTNSLTSKALASAWTTLSAKELELAKEGNAKASQLAENKFFVIIIFLNPI